MNKSLFVLSLPRSLSSAVFHMSALALDLEKPNYTTDGEILNSDRLNDEYQEANGEFKKYANRDLFPEEVQKQLDYLDQTVRPRGHVYKDVVQPFVMNEWLKDKDFPTLIIERNIVDVAYPMIVREWNYPALVSSNYTEGKPTIFDVLEGLKMAESCLADTPGIRIRYDDLVMDESVLHTALSELFPEKEVPFVRFIDEAFIEYRDMISTRCETDLYKEIKASFEQMKTNHVFINP